MPPENLRTGLPSNNETSETTELSVSSLVSSETTELSVSSLVSSETTELSVSSLVSFLFAKSLNKPVKGYISGNKFKLIL